MEESERERLEEEMIQDTEGWKRVRKGHRSDPVQIWIQMLSRRSQDRSRVVSKSSASQLKPSEATSTASVHNTSRETKSEMKISMASDVTHQPSTTSPSHQPAAVTTTTAEDLALDQFQQMGSMITRLLGNLN